MLLAAGTSRTSPIVSRAFTELRGAAGRMCHTASRQIANALLATLLAPRCAACDQSLTNPVDGPVCRRCWTDVRLISPPVCDQCGDPLPSWRVLSQQAARCPRCRRAARTVDRGRAVGEYEGSLRAIIHALKYRKRRSLAPPLAALMRRQGADLLQGADWIVPVPLHPRRSRARGFNQSEDLARALGLPVSTSLVRVRHTPPQVDLPSGQRHRNVREAFEVRSPRWRRVRGRTAHELADTCVVLVDDVSTTGATLEACARALKQAGVREVRALTAARVVTRPR